VCISVDGQTCGFSGDRLGLRAPCGRGDDNHSNSGLSDRPVLRQFTSIPLTAVLKQARGTL
jgi:hypothetical protein